MIAKRTTLIVILWMLAQQVSAVAGAWSMTAQSESNHGNVSSSCHDEAAAPQLKGDTHRAHVMKSETQDQDKCCDSACQCCFTGCHYGAVSAIDLLKNQSPISFQSTYQFSYTELTSASLFRPPISL